jgi:hypothetical protein
MKIMGQDKAVDQSASLNADNVNRDDNGTSSAEVARKEVNPLSKEEMLNGTKVDADDESARKVVDSGLYKSDKVAKNGVEITASDKKRFIDAIISNSRFTSEYSLFGGRVKAVIRSLTTEEARAVATYLVKTSITDVVGQTTGKYRKYLLAAHVEEYNGVKFAPIPEPLFSEVGEGGAEKAPAWVEYDAVKFWEKASPAVVSAVAECVADFEAKYEYLTKKAEDANFWESDTP